MLVGAWYYKHMKILPRNQARKVWDRYWADMKQEWFKIEVLQDYTGEDDSPSLRAWLAGDRQKSLDLLKQTTHQGWSERCKQKHDQGVLMRRIRVIEEPLTPYTEWELEFYQHINIPNGERLFTINKQATEHMNLPSGDLMMFDNQRAVVCAYDKTGRVTQQTFYDEGDDIAPFLQLKHDFLALARPL